MERSSISRTASTSPSIAFAMRSEIPRRRPDSSKRCRGVATGSSLRSFDRPARLRKPSRNCRRRCGTGRGARRRSSARLSPSASSRCSRRDGRSRQRSRRSDPGRTGAGGSVDTADRLSRRRRVSGPGPGRPASGVLVDTAHRRADAPLRDDGRFCRAATDHRAVTGPMNHAVWSSDGRQHRVHSACRRGRTDLRRVSAGRRRASSRPTSTGADGSRGRRTIGICSPDATTDPSAASGPCRSTAAIHASVVAAPPSGGARAVALSPDGRRWHMPPVATCRIYGYFDCDADVVALDAALTATGPPKSARHDVDAGRLRVDA